MPIVLRSRVWQLALKFALILHYIVHDSLYVIEHRATAQPLKFPLWARYILQLNQLGENHWGVNFSLARRYSVNEARGPPKVLAILLRYELYFRR
jgi:hypothetical protein